MEHLPGEDGYDRFRLISELILSYEGSIQQECYFLIGKLKKSE